MLQLDQDSCFKPVFLTFDKTLCIAIGRLWTKSECHAQVKEQKSFLAKLETADMGKPIQEAEWDMVGFAALSCHTCAGFQSQTCHILDLSTAMPALLHTTTIPAVAPANTLCCYRMMWLAVLSTTLT